MSEGPDIDSLKRSIANFSTWNQPTNPLVSTRRPQFALAIPEFKAASYHPHNVLGIEVDTTKDLQGSADHL